MIRVLFIGQKPKTVDFSDPALPPGFDADRINAGIAMAIAKIEKQLSGARYDCVVIGGGLRLPPKGLALFERVVNTVHKAAPGAAIAFNTQPEDTAEAAARQLEAGP